MLVYIIHAHIYYVSQLMKDTHKAVIFYLVMRETLAPAGVIAYNNYLNNVKPGLQVNEDFGIEDFVDLFSFLTSILGL